MALKRVNIMIDDKLHARIQKDKLNLSAVIREKLEDHYSGHTITLSVSQKIKDKYIAMMELTNGSDKELSPFIEDALIKYLKHKKKEINSTLDTLISKK